MPGCAGPLFRDCEVATERELSAVRTPRSSTIRLKPDRWSLSASRMIFRLWAIEPGQPCEKRITDEPDERVEFSCGKRDWRLEERVEAGERL